MSRGFEIFGWSYFLRFFEIFEIFEIF
ncbi:hypothetical protein JL09_g4370 [Pichia kudriavzevii]|uniref:Uncharacterized protein n=1 Tax=Pichia kudriavzevii TaxID=4909 RepID=A0A099NX10_PICKU|nr:hypothetical protein JL09_g4370 [Pichia kudriavzevii]